MVSWGFPSGIEPLTTRLRGLAGSTATSRSDGVEDATVVTFDCTVKAAVFGVAAHGAGLPDGTRGHLDVQDVVVNENRWDRGLLPLGTSPRAGYR